LEKDLTILKLKESLEKDYGDYGRTQYVIEKLKKELPLPKSDHMYIERMIKLCETVIEEPEPEEIPEIVLSEDLIKCYFCNLQIELDEKSIRKNNFWFHDKCFEKIPITKPQVSQKIVVVPKVSQKIVVVPKVSQKIVVAPKVSQKIVVAPKAIRQSVRIVESKTTVTHMAFSGGLLITLVGTAYVFSGEILATLMGLWGSAGYLAVYRSQFFKKKKQDVPIVKIGIPGFDSILSTGLKKNSSVAISGPPGSGKTTFGLQFIYSGAKEFDEPGVYISLSQSIDEMKNDCKAFGWDIDDLIAKEKILMIDLRPFKIKDEVIGKDDSLYRGEQIPFEHLTKFILNSIKKIKAKRIVIDSISILGMQYSDKFYMRQGLQGMIQSLENFDVTSLLISEFSENNDTPLEWVVTSGVIQLDNQIVNDKMKRTIKITKLRGIEHDENVHSLGLGSNGLYVYDD